MSRNLDWRLPFALAGVCAGWLVSSCVATGGGPRALSCEAVPGLATLLQPGTVSLFGEIHGTVEAPAFFSEVICGAVVTGHSVTVGLEFPDTESDELSAYLDSEGTEEDQNALLATTFWQQAYQDGRASKAMFDMIEQLRRIRRAQYPLKVLVFDSSQRFESSQDRDQALAERLKAAIMASDSELFMVLTGNIHARLVRGTRWDSSFQPMAYLLAEELREQHWISLNLSTSGGTAWVCSVGPDAECGVRSLRRRTETRLRGIMLDEEREGRPYGGYYHLGDVTASPPAHSTLGHGDGK